MRVDFLVLSPTTLQSLSVAIQTNDDDDVLSDPVVVLVLVRQYRCTQIDHKHQ